MKTNKNIERHIKARAVTMIWRNLTEYGFHYRVRDIRKMLYFDKNLHTWAVRIFVEKYWAPKYECGEFGDAVCGLTARMSAVMKFLRVEDNIHQFKIL